MRFTLLIGGIFLYGVCLGQNYPLYSSYITNPFLINPAEAASDHLNIFANYRTQWVGMQGAPKIGTIGVTTLLNNTRVGIGFKASSFKRGFLNSTDASLTYAYGVPINKQNKLFFGLSGGILSNSVDWNMVSDNSDPALTTLKGGIMPSMSFGMLLKNTSGVHVGLVFPQMFRANSLSKNFAIAAQDNIILTAYYSNWHEQTKITSHNKSKKAHKNSKNKGNPLEVFSLFRYSDVGLQVEATAKFNFQSHLWFSAGYRKASGIIPGLGFNVGNFSAGYFFESGLGGDIPLNSHEISLNLRLGAEKKFKGEGGKAPDKPTTVPTTRPRYENKEPKISNKGKKPTNTPVVAKETESKEKPSSTNIVNEVKKDEPVVVVPEVKKVPVAVVPEQKKEDPVVIVPDVKKEQAAAVTEVKKEPVVVPDVKKEPVVVPEAKKDPVVAVPDEKEEPALASHEDKAQHEDEQEKISRLTDHKENPTEEHNEEGHPHAERHEFAKRGNHASELDLGDYVIVGVFKGEANAKHFSGELKKLGFSEVDFGYLTEKAVWYVHIAGGNDIQEAKNKRNKYRKMKMFKDAWLLTVHQ
jgi:type IX secretion system PorP/SprF family membrane protein